MPDPTIGLINSAKGSSWWQDSYVQEIIPGLYLGAQKEEHSMPYPELAKLGIKLVIELLDEPLFSLAPPRAPQGIKYLPIALTNSEYSNIIPLLDETSSFIREGLYQKRKVLVCSTHGNSRSAVIVAAYLMELLKIGANEAIDRVSSIRPSINPNKGFRDQLLDYESILKARNLIIMGASSSSYQMRPKRIRECAEDESSSPAEHFKRRPMELMS
ncbi:serine/threonine/tyrosine-interacting protein isoform X2 [Dendroctonus ponderosae]|uniref:Tyrosine-protein phosphatase domain-containing protein n=1 Tax=Dendroctonus ponderosae TaxID=77166 RepID=A0AAR5Q2X8_DENPD|nr:serine/threonine/tyrosine-interacting protein isoform X2 [Dendroctonus ponderosae]